MMYVFDFDLLRGATENSRIIVKDADGNEVGISSLSTDENGDVVLTLIDEQEDTPKFCDIRDCDHDGCNCDECFTKKFWLDVLKERSEHFVTDDGDTDDVLYYTSGNGGFYGARFDVTFEDGRVLSDQGLWGRGRVPSSYVRDMLPRAKIQRL